MVCDERMGVSDERSVEERTAQYSHATHLSGDDEGEAAAGALLQELLGEVDADERRGAAHAPQVEALDVPPHPELSGLATTSATRAVLASGWCVTFVNPRALTLLTIIAHKLGVGENRLQLTTRMSMSLALTFVFLRALATMSKRTVSASLREPSMELSVGCGHGGKGGG